eukprot:3159133-Rhodomonas_salina.3
MSRTSIELAKSALLDQRLDQLDRIRRVSGATSRTWHARDGERRTLVACVERTRSQKEKRTGRARAECPLGLSTTERMFSHTISMLSGELCVTDAPCPRAHDSESSVLMIRSMHRSAAVDSSSLDAPA